MVGKKKGFVQAGHGKKASVERLEKDDYIIFYSSKTSLQNGKPVQAFTAVAKIKDRDAYQVLISDTFQPYRKDAVYEDSREIPIRPLIEQLEFITNKTHWGFRFRSGLFEINQHDFELIYGMMKDL